MDRRKNGYIQQSMFSGSMTDLGQQLHWCVVIYGYFRYIKIKKIGKNSC